MLIRTATTLLPGRCNSFTLGSSSLTWLCGVPSALFLLLCLPSGCGHPFGSLVSFVTIDRQRRVSFGGVFRLGGSLPFRSGVVVSLRPLSVCHGSMWLVPAFFPSLSLSFPVCAHFQLAGIFFCLLTALHPTSGSWYAGFLWLLFSTRVAYLRDEVTPAGSWTACPRSQRRFSISIWGQVRWSVPGWTSRLCLRVSARHVTQDVLPGGPHVSLPLGYP